MSIFITSCNKSDTSSNIPLVTVNFKVYPSDPAYSKLQIPGGWLYVTGGSMGIIIYRVSESTFTALDRHSTYLPNNRCRVSVDNTQVTAVDSCSGSKWVITDGSVMNGPASRPLQKYACYWDGYTLTVKN
jgi:hypothetical protein